MQDIIPLGSFCELCTFFTQVLKGELLLCFGKRYFRQIYKNRTLAIYGLREKRYLNKSNKSVFKKGRRKPGLDSKYQGWNLVSWRILFVEGSKFARRHVIIAHLFVTNKEHIYTICYFGRTIPEKFTVTT